MTNNLQARKTRWELRALIVGLSLSVVGNIISIPVAIQQWKMGKVERERIALDVCRLKDQKALLEEQKTAFKQQILDAKQELEGRIRDLDEHREFWHEKAKAAFEQELETACEKARTIREEANKTIRALNESVRRSLVDRFSLDVSVGAVHLLAYDLESGVNRVVSLEQLSQGHFTQVRHEALVNGERVRTGDVVNGLTIKHILQQGVTFSTSTPDYHEKIEFTLEASHMLILDFEEYLRLFPELSVK